jgi:hypothetical protein
MAPSGDRTMYSLPPADRRLSRRKRRFAARSELCPLLGKTSGFGNDPASLLVGA